MTDGGSKDIDPAMLRRAVKNTKQVEPTGGQDNFGNKLPDFWGIDVPIHRDDKKSFYSYEQEFDELLQLEGVTDFPALLKQRKLRGQSTHVLDLFGSGYKFFDALPVADSITAVRLADNSQQTIQHLQNRIEALEKPGYVSKDMPEDVQAFSDTVRRLQTLTTSPQWGIVEGNLYRASTWGKLREYQAKKGIPAFDVVTIHPAAAFGDEVIFDEEDFFGQVNPSRELAYGSIMLELLGRVYGSLSQNGGELYSQVPRFISGEGAPNNFLGMLKSVGEGEGGVKVDISRKDKQRVIKITRFPNSTPDLKGLITSRLSRDSENLERTRFPQLKPHKNGK